MRYSPNIQIFPTVDKAVSILATDITTQLRTAIAANGAARIALSGGQSPRKLYRLLASPSYSSMVDWSNVYFFFGDERYVPHTSEESNAYWANQTLLQPLGISKENIFRVNTSLKPEKAAADYLESIRQHFSSAAIHFDLVLLGLGDNAHTASLFPGTPVLKDESPSVDAVFVPELSAFRITFNAPLINAARQVAFLVYGKSKATAVRDVLDGPRDPQRYPAQLIRPELKAANWYLDDAAASMLSAERR